MKKRNQLMLTKLGNLKMLYDEKTYIHAKDCWKEMKLGWEEGTYKIPELFRKYKRKFYHAVCESGNELSGYASVPLNGRKGDEIKSWRKDNDLEEDHPYAPEMIGVHMYDCGEHYFTSIDQFHENFLPFFVLCRRTILVPGKDNRSLSYTSGVFHDHSDKIKEVPSCLTKDKYPRIGINVLYDIDSYDREIKIEDAIPVPEIFTNWQENQHKLWEDEVNPLVKFYN